MPIIHTKRYVISFMDGGEVTVYAYNIDHAIELAAIERPEHVVCEARRAA